MRTAHDVLLDSIEAGADVVLFVWGTQPRLCAYPENTPLTAYGYGCRCSRCRKAAQQAQHQQRKRAAARRGNR